MQQQRFLFSNQRRYRWRRHVLFWTFWAVFQASLYASIFVSNLKVYLQRWPVAMIESLLYLPCHMFLSYALMYFVIPRYVVTTRYVSAILWCAFLVLFTGALSAAVAQYLVIPMREALGVNSSFPRGPALQRGAFSQAMLAGLRGGLTVGGIAAAIKLMKHWYTEGQRNLQLQKENAESQLQLLKAQVHPHFLFNTLNNIYAYTQGRAPVAGQLVMGLADMLRYMLYECKRPQVLLSKELGMVEGYLELERIRYGNKLEIHVSLPNDAHQWNIAPLLLLPFVENCFKHGTSSVLEQPWISMDVTMQGPAMALKLMNSKAPQQHKWEAHGIGIDNVRRRLELLYPQKHTLEITNQQDVFVVDLMLQLEPAPLLQKSNTAAALTT